MKEMLAVFVGLFCLFFVLALAAFFTVDLVSDYEMVVNDFKISAGVGFWMALYGLIHIEHKKIE